MRGDLVLDALKMALGQRGPGADVELVHHSDRGSQYTSIDYTQTLADHHVLASVGSVGDAYDNALAESFVDSFKTELIADRVWQTRSSSSSPSSSTSAGTTMAASTRASATCRRASTNSAGTPRTRRSRRIRVSNHPRRPLAAPQKRLQRLASSRSEPKPVESSLLA
jgi:transposase InsO family protein